MLKGKIKKVIAASLIALASLSIFSSSASADTLSGTVKDGVNRPIWYSPSVVSYGYTGTYDIGRAYWNADTKANLWRWDKVNNSTDRYYIGTSDGGNLDTTGKITPYKVSSTGVATLAETYDNWNFSVVTLYHDAFQKKRWHGLVYRAMDADEIRKTAAHEVGHTLKMAHNTTMTSLDTVMRQGIYDIPSTKIRTYDKNEFVKKWGY
jgi:hypothetical protein